MEGALSLVTAPATEPVSMAEAKLHMGVTITEDNVYITSLLLAAKDQVEDICSIRCVNQTWKWTLDAFPSERFLRVPLAPLVSVSSIKYTDSSGVQTTLSSSDYIVDAVSVPGRIVLKDTASWPSTTLQAANGIEVEFVCGYGASAVGVPQRLKQAILFLAAQWYTNREASTPLASDFKTMPDAFKALVAQFRMWLV